MKGAIIKKFGLMVLSLALVSISAAQSRPMITQGKIETTGKPGESRVMSRFDGKVTRSDLTTTKFFPQVDRSLTARGVRPSNPGSTVPVLPPQSVIDNLMKRDRTSVSTVPFGGTSLAGTPASGMKFPGISFTGSVPPDPHIAVGPNHIVQVVNTSVAFFDKTTGALQFLQPLSRAGFLPRAGNFVFDPRVIFDPDSNIWVVVALDVDFNTGESFVHMAFSDDANPNGRWNVAKINNTIEFGVGDPFWGDYPSLTSSPDSWTVTFNHFPFASASAPVPTVFVVKKSNFEIFSADTGVSVTSMAKKMTAGPGVPIGAGLFFPFLFFGVIPIDPAIGMIAVRDNVTPPVIETEFVPLSVFVRQVEGAATAGFNIDAIGDRMMDMSRTGDSIVFAFTANIGPDEDGYEFTSLDQTEDRQTKVRWGEVALNNWPEVPATPTLVQEGQVASEEGDGVSFLMPAIVKNVNGSILLVMTEAGEEFTPKIVAAGRRATDGPGALTAPAVFGQSANFTIDGGTDLESRWGDYAGISVDPNDPDRFWACHELFTNAGLRWRTEIFDVRLKTTVPAARQVLSVNTIFGTNTAGDVDSFDLLNDNDQYEIAAEAIDQRGNYAGYEIVIDTTGLVDGGRLNLAMSATTEGVSGFIYAFNHQTNRFDLLNSVRLKGTTVNFVQLFSTQQLQAYRAPGLDQMTIRVVTLNTIRRRGVNPNSFTFKTDLGRLTINEQ